jgi:hypothetical protein
MTADLLIMLGPVIAFAVIILSLCRTAARADTSASPDRAEQAGFTATSVRRGGS